jgi:hypothetical protein
MYVALLTWFALLLPLLRRPLVLFLLSAGVYVTMRVTGINFPSWTGGGWYFNPIAWQFLFIIGAILAYAPPRPRVPPRVLDVLALVILAVGLILLWAVWPYPDIEARVLATAARALISVDKEGLHPMRLLSILALAWLVSRTVRKDAAWLHSAWARPFIVCGQHSLPVFCVGIFLSFLARLAMEEVDGWVVMAVVNLLGTMGLFGIGALASWYKEKGRVVRPDLPETSRAGNAQVI